MVLERQRGRILCASVAATLSVSMLSGSGMRARADEPGGGQTPAAAPYGFIEQLDLTDAPLVGAIKLIKQKTGINIAFVNNQGYQYGTVTLNVRRKPVEEVLKLMARSAGADLWEEDGTFFIGPQGSAPQPVKAEPLLPENDPTPNLVYPTRWEKIKLNYISPQQLLRYLGINGGLMQDAGDMLKISATRMMQLMNQDMSRPTTLRPPEVLTPSANGLSNVAAPAAPIGNQPQFNNNSNNQNGPANFNAPGNNDQNVRRDGSDQLNEFNRGGQPPGLGGRGGGGAGGFGQGAGGFQGGPGGGQQGGLQGGQQGQAGAAGGLLPDGINPGDIFAYDATGDIIVRVTGPQGEQALRDLRQIIQLLDVKPRQIMVRAEFITLTQNDLSSFGINWSFQRVNLVGGVNTGFSTSNTAFLQYAAGNFQTQLSWILTQGRGKLVAAPMATTLNNVPVSFFTTQQIPIISSTPIITNNGTAAVSTFVQYLPAFTSLNVLPRINGDDTITLFGSVTITDLGSTVTGPNGETYPNIISQTAPVQRIIRNGDTMVIGGLTRKNNNISTNKVPLLGDLPLIGTLFRSRNVSTSDSDLLVFITASILPERQPNAPLPGVGGAGGPVAAPVGGAGPGGAGGGVNP